jgi:CBS domain-containing protein
MRAFSDAGTLKGDERVAEAVRFIRDPPLRRTMMPAYRVLFAGAVASIPAEYRELLGLRRSRLPVVWATGLVLGLVGALLGTTSTSEDAARARIARLDAAAPTG